MEFRGIHVKQELDDGIESKTCKGDAIKGQWASRKIVRKFAQGEIPPLESGEAAINDYSPWSNQFQTPVIFFYYFPSSIHLSYFHLCPYVDSQHSDSPIFPFYCTDPSICSMAGEELSKKQAAQEAQMRKLRAQVVYLVSCFLSRGKLIKFCGLSVCNFHISL